MEEDFSPEFIAESIELLSEALTDEQKKKVDSWYQYGNPHKEVFGDTDRIRIPYDDSKDEPITRSGQTGRWDAHHNIVLNALSDRGYKTDDYVSGTAYHESDPKRKYRIGSLLSGEHDKGTRKLTMTGANKGKPMSLSQVYAADPVRGAAKTPKEIVISKNKYDVAGVSTDRGWSSCMDMDGGSNKHYLPKDIANHTLAAYLVKKGEDPDKNPLGRISIKQFYNEGHKIWRPENGVYGAAPRGFHSQVSSWADEKYPSKEGFYQKHPELYNDDGKNLLMEKSHSDSEKIHRDIESAVYHAVKAARNLRDNHDWHKDPDGPDDGDPTFGIPQKIADIHDKIPEKDKVHSIVHHLIKNADEDLDDCPDIHDNNVEDKMLHSYAAENADKMFGRRKSPFKDFGPGESIELLGKLHNEAKDYQGADYESKTRSLMGDAHHDLIDHVLSHTGKSKEWDAAGDVALGHIVTPSHEDYYGDLNPGHTRYLLNHTKNPRLMHTILNNNEDERDSTFQSHPVMEHMGKYADAKLAHEVYHHPDLGYGHAASLINGTNENKNGEAIQHELTSQMLLTGGHDNEGNDLSDSHAQLHMHVAKLTKFKSVYDKIKARSTSDLDHPDVHAGLKANHNFHVAEQTDMDRYLRVFKK
jgi:hypothetical protein